MDKHCEIGQKWPDISQSTKIGYVCCFWWAWIGENVTRQSINKNVRTVPGQPPKLDKMAKLGLK